MNYTLGVFVFTLCLINLLTAGVHKETKSSVSFKEIGTYSTHENTKITALQKRTDTKSDFKAQGILKGMAAKLILNPGTKSDIVNLQQMNIIKLDHEDKEYDILPIEKIKVDINSDEGQDIKEEEYEEKTEQAESDRRIIRSEFKVQKTGEKKQINDFNCEKYTILWLTEWEQISTGNIGKDSLFTVVWTSPLSSEMKTAQQEEEEFNKEYMKNIGLELSNTEQVLLGTTWLSLFQTMNQQDTQNEENEYSNMGQELEKIKDYPIVIDGNYYTITPEDKQDEEEESSGSGGIFGGFAKKLIKKKSEPSKQGEPAFSYYTELITLQSADISEKEFEIPEGFKKK